MTPSQRYQSQKDSEDSSGSYFWDRSYSYPIKLNEEFGF